MKLRFTLGGGVVGVALLSGTAGAQLALPCFSDFGADTIGATPVLGAPDNPTHLLRSLDTEPMPVVQGSALGLDDKPVTFGVAPESGSGALLIYDFAPNITTAILRAEATVSLSDYASLLIMRSWENSFGLVIGNVYVSEAGAVNGSGAQVGTYEPGTPFRVRMDVDVVAGVYALTVDNELDGFGDDTPVGGLTFTNDPVDVDNVGGFGIGYLNGSTDFAGVTLAFDDVHLREIPGPSALALGAIALVSSRRRRGG